MTSVLRRGRGKSRRSLELIEACIEILQEIQPATVRAVCYRLFTLELIDSMSKNNTNKVGRQLTDARERGWVPWGWIVDETRAPETVPSWDSPAEILQAAARQYRKDRWSLQPTRLEIWSEKGTIRGVLRPVLDEYGVTFRVMHGYGSATAVHDIAEESRRDRRPFRAFYVGDFDPSGFHMSEVDLPSRLAEYGAVVELVRLALVGADTVDLPGFDVDTKRGDPRWRWFRDRFGARGWELDALAPPILRQRVAAAMVAEIRDPAAWERCPRAEAAERESLTIVLDAWNAGRPEAEA